ncbi:unnamed protein product [Paramecium sonneborni]|uniref:Uncharacterized protein n=1 Tax=Paramecium sonneborni TaxID=65129 RepID=A0A8S1PVA5_9CILI|nr:unnamed protein product [Paramecium sonneborni]
MIQQIQDDQRILQDPNNQVNKNNKKNLQDNSELIELIRKKLQGQREEVQALYSISDNQLDEENQRGQTVEDTSELNSKEIKITYYESKLIEKILTYYKTEAEDLLQQLNQKEESQIELLLDQLSLERSKTSKNEMNIIDIKEQLRVLMKKYEEKFQSLHFKVKKMLKPLEDEQDFDVQIIS